MDDGIITEDVLEESLKIAQGPPEKKIGETLISKGKVTPKQLSKALRKQADRITDTTTIRVDIGKLDDLIDMVGELVITQSMIQEALKKQSNTDRNLMRNISQFFRITSELQRVSTGLRMIPIKQIFQRVSRLVRDLAKDAGKLVAVEMQGEETEIDRNMVDEIYNPIVHMIRNSVDHGIEMPGERVKLGKPEQGLIRLKAYHRGGNIIIEISDDGRGLGKEKILEKAIKNGIINSADSLTDQDIFRLIFLPGLSTAKAVTDVSGRGVGMDVVKQAVEKLRGKIEIESLYGNGTTFMVSFPLTMAIIDGIILKVGTEYYILPTMAIRQMLRPSRDIYNNIIGKGETINVMGQLLPLVKLYDLFHIKPECRDPWEGIVAVVDGDGRSKCLLVDKIIGKAEVVIKSLGDGLKNIKGVSAGAILGDGNVGLILDPEGLFELSEERSTIPM
jgi:two-component system chemotaxis sensor kinase CheA